MSSAPMGKWTVGLCAGGDSLATCFITWCLPCITFGEIAEAVDDGQISLVAHCCAYGMLWAAGCHWIYGCLYRKKLRNKYGLPPEPCCDCCVHYCCGLCALCQEYAELKNRITAPSRGSADQATAPPMPPTMHK